ncbi:fatty acid conjugase [Gautieria morchelliformis]|nr:fatty acid conjugase [Gautieria morchelliformis]
MSLVSFTSNGREYEARCQQDFVPPNVLLKELRDVVPQAVFKKSTVKGVYYVVRGITMSFAFFKLAACVDPLAASLSARTLAFAVRWSLWIIYWTLQGLAWGGFWTLGHEAGHGTLSPHTWVNHLLGFSIHTFLMVPYFSWRWTHRKHHKGTASLERDENYVPRTRRDLKLPESEFSTPLDYHEILEEAPMYTLGRLVFMTLCGFQLYMGFNAMGSPSYPPGTNHINPWSPLFKKEHWHLVMLSNVGLSFMFGVLMIWVRQNGFAAFVKHYLIPYILANHWVVILTFLQHSDPTIPHYRKGQWTFVRGALATVDRPFLGWAGRFFLHNISHDHTAHHLFSNVPFYNLPQVTDAIKPVLGNHYSYDSTYTFYALWRSFTQCWFVEDRGDIIFYLNKGGEPARRLKESDTPKKNLDACTAQTPPSTSKSSVGFSTDAGSAQDQTKTIELDTRRVERRTREMKTPAPAAM